MGKSKADYTDKISMVPMKSYDDSKWNEDSKFLDAPLFYAKNKLKIREIKAGDGLRVDFKGEPLRGKTVVVEIKEKYATVEVYTGQPYVGVVRIIEKDSL